MNSLINRSKVLLMGLVNVPHQFSRSTGIPSLRSSPIFSCLGDCGGKPSVHLGSQKEQSACSTRHVIFTKKSEGGTFMKGIHDVKECYSRYEMELNDALAFYKAFIERKSGGSAQ